MVSVLGDGFLWASSCMWDAGVHPGTGLAFTGLQVVKTMYIVQDRHCIMLHAQLCPGSHTRTMQAPRRNTAGTPSSHHKQRKRKPGPAHLPGRPA